MEKASVRTIKWVNESHLVGDSPLRMIPDERKEMTKVLGFTRPQSQYLKRIKNKDRRGMKKQEAGYSLGDGVFKYVKNDQTKKEGINIDKCLPPEKFEQNGLSSAVDTEILRVHQSKLLNSPMAVSVAGGVQKCKKKQEKDLGGHLMMKNSSPSSRNVMEVNRVMMTNNYEKIYRKYQLGTRNT